MFISKIGLQSYHKMCIRDSNGSKDRCGEIIENFAKSDKRIKVVNIEHGSISKARNSGIAVSTAPYITCLLYTSYDINFSVKSE